MKRRPVTRVVVFLALIAAGALFYWQLQAQPVETPLVFVLTGLEVPGPRGLMRHEDVTRLECAVIDDEGREVATISHRSPGAVARPAPVRLPRATYSVRCTLHLERGGHSGTRSILQQHELAGEPITIHL